MFISAFAEGLLSSWARDIHEGKRER